MNVINTLKNHNLHSAILFSQYLIFLVKPISQGHSNFISYFTKWNKVL